jgi:glyceraldehyde 3-phosphate dehydrogenase
MNIGINGMGRIGRLVLRAAMGNVERPSNDPNANNRLNITHINEPTGKAKTLAHLLSFDSVQGKWRANIRADSENALLIDNTRISMTAHRSPAEIPWGDLGIDVVLECSGHFLSPETLQGHLDRGAKRVIVSAPVKADEVLNIVMGVNHQMYDPAKHHIVTAASCTTNCLAAVVKVVHEHLGIKHAQITTIHDPTNTNTVVDAPLADLRQARSAMMNLIPTTTGSASAIALIYPELKGKVNGHAVRAPVFNASLTDVVFELQRATTADEVNALFEHASKNELAGILGYETRPLVSADYAHDTRSAIVDALSTLVTDDTMLKVYAWYDNEMGYACRMVDLACYLREVGV